MKPRKLLIILLGLPLIYLAYLLLGTGFFLKKNLFAYYKYENNERNVYFTHIKPKSWVKIKNINPKVKWPIVLSEDWAFYDHEGVDWNQLSKVLKESVAKGSLTRGASTISQQLVKNLFLNHNKSIFRKLNELILTQFLEFFCSKDWILEQYLNIVELGDHKDGITQASWHYFNKSQSKLSYREGAFLAMLLPSPKRYSESFRKKKLSEFAQKQVDKILSKLVMAKLITEDELFNIEAETFSWERDF